MVGQNRLRQDERRTPTRSFKNALDYHGDVPTPNGGLAAPRVPSDVDVQAVRIVGTTRSH